MVFRPEYQLIDNFLLQIHCYVAGRLAKTLLRGVLYYNGINHFFRDNSFVDCLDRFVYCAGSIALFFASVLKAAKFSWKGSE